MITFQRAVEWSTASVKRLYWREPRKVRLGLRIAARQAGETGWLSPVAGRAAPNTVRVDCGAVGARSRRWVCGLLQTPPADALAERKERSSRKNSSRFLPQRKLR